MLSDRACETTLRQAPHIQYARVFDVDERLYGWRTSFKVCLAQWETHYLDIPNAKSVFPYGWRSLFKVSIYRSFPLKYSALDKTPHPSDIADPQHPVPTSVQVAVRRHYFAAIHWMDAKVGEVLSALSDLGLDNSTVIIFHADHGYFQGTVQQSC